MQELIASQNVDFFNANWVKLGTKTSLEKLLSEVTKLPAVILKGGRMATFGEWRNWVSLRQTSREEDLAYCLIGLVGFA